jgi:Fe-Mn family superoxide dismutase
VTRSVTGNDRDGLCQVLQIHHPRVIDQHRIHRPSSQRTSMAHTLPDLPYTYDGLEPFISRQIMELHHKKHHQTYVNSLNAAEASYAKAPTPKERIALQAVLKFNGGGQSFNPFVYAHMTTHPDHISGHINHSLFWKNLAPAASEGKGIGGTLKPGPLKEAIDAAFGSFDKFKEEFNAATLGIQGSGWGWLVRHSFLFRQPFH